MEVSQSSNITEDEAKLYDRQIRLWGLDAQKRLRAARVLLIGVGGLGAEVAKNIVLAGIKSIHLLDDQLVTEKDTHSQFFIDKNDIGFNRAEKSAKKTQLLNPMVEVTSDSGSVGSKPDSFFKSFDVIIATCCSEKDMIRIDDLCQENNILFFAGDVFGYYGYMFADLGLHDYAEEILNKKKPDNTSGEPANKKPKIEEEETKTVKKHTQYARLKQALNVDWSSPVNSAKLKKIPKVYFILKALLEFRTINGRGPSAEHQEADGNHLSEVRSMVLEHLGVGSDYIPEDYFKYCLDEVSPVCAITGGILGQEIIKAVSKKDAPHNNFFFFDAIDGSGLVDRIE